VSRAAPHDARMRRIALLLLVSLAACGATPVAPVSPDAGSTPAVFVDASATFDAAAPDAGGCAALAPATSSVSEGGRLALTLAPDVEVEPTAGLGLGSRAGEVEIWSAYGALEAQALTLRRAGCADQTVAVEVRPLSWTQVARWDPATEGPPAREYGAWWATEGGFYLLGGFHYVPRQFTPSADLWWFDYATATWTQLPAAGAPAAGGARLAEGPEAGSLFLFGGATLVRNGSLDTPSRLVRVRLDRAATVWESAPHEATAPGSYTGAFIHDRRRERWLSVCGADSMRLGVNCEVLEYTTAGGWRALSPEGERPPGRFGFAYAHDAVDDRVIVFGGQGEGAGVLGDTWALELGEAAPRWVRLFEDDRAIARRNGAFVLDPVGRRLIVWGGTADGRRPNPGLDVLRVARGQERWDHVETPTEVPARASGFAVYDPAGRRALMGFGNAAALYTDLFSLSL
jgi:hypothetical protein